MQDLSTLFGRDAPRHLEIGCGDGTTLIALAQNHPGCDFLGCEVYRPGLGHLMQQLARLGLANVRLLAMDAREVLELLRDRSIDEIHVYFPDPWPKRRQRKRRLITPEFLHLANRVLSPGGRLHIATDCPDYATAIAAISDEAHGFLNLAGELIHAPRPKARPITRFEARAKRLDHEVFDFLLAAVPKR